MKTRQGIHESDVVRPRVVGAGLLALDVLIDESTVSSRAELGGSTGNVLAILAFLGWSSVPVARLGHDAAGDRIRREFELLHADTRFIKHELHARTPVVYQWPGDASGTHRFSFSCPFCGQKRGFSAEVGDEHCHSVLRSVERSDVFYFDRVTDVSLGLAENYRRRGALVVFEPSTVNVERGAFQRAINACHILKYADERIEELEAFDCTSVEVVIQTLGEKGLRFKAADSPAGTWRRLPAFKVPLVRDTAGAGDWCTAGLLYVLHGARVSAQLNTSAVATALRFGQALAALNCMHSGARGLAQDKVRERIQELASLFRSHEHVEWSATREWSDLYHSDGLAEESRQQVAWRRDDFKCSTRLCCEFLPV